MTQMKSQAGCLRCVKSLCNLLFFAEARGEASEEAKRAAEDLLNSPQMNKMATKTGKISVMWAE